MIDRSKITVNQLLSGKVKSNPAVKRSDAYRIVDRDIRRNLAISLEEMRAKLKMSKGKFAPRLGFTYRHYARIMAGKSAMTAASIILLSRKTGYSVMRLLRVKESGYFEDMVE